MRDVDALLRSLTGPTSSAPPPSVDLLGEGAPAPSVDALLRALDGPRSSAPAPAFEAPAAAPPTPANTPFRATLPLPRARWQLPSLALGLVGLAAGVALFVSPPAPPTLRGAPATPVVDLRMAVDRGGPDAMRVSAGGRYHVGDEVFFRLAVTPAARVRVWVDGPTGRTAIAEVAADASPTDLGSTGGLIAWRFDTPGRYTFTAGAVDDPACDGCAHLDVEVR